MAVEQIQKSEKRKLIRQLCFWICFFSERLSPVFVQSNVSATWTYLKYTPVIELLLVSLITSVNELFASGFLIRPGIEKPGTQAFSVRVREAFSFL